jgi:type 1 glutamine amidotransferase
MRTGALALLVALVAFAPAAAADQPVDPPPTSFRALVFTRTAGFRHDSIPDAVEAITSLGQANGFGVDATEDPAVFDDATLPGYAAVAFVLTTGDVLDDQQQGAFERYIRAGGGYLGVHSATDTEYDWPWYGGLVGAYFADHPPGTYRATVHVEGPTRALLPETWLRTDEWYNFRSNPRSLPDVHVLATLDESTYPGGTMGDHPIAWYHAYDGGRAWYTAGGHTRESYHEPLFMAHLLEGLLYAAGASNIDFVAPAPDPPA